MVLGRILGFFGCLWGLCAEGWVEVLVGDNQAHMGGFFAWDGFRGK